MRALVRNPRSAPPLPPPPGPLVRAIVSGAPGTHPPPPVESHHWNDELSIVVEANLAPAALQLLREAPGRPDPLVLERLTSATYEASVISLRVEAAAIVALRQFRANAIPYVIVKGPAVGRYYSSALLRPYTDIDLVVAPSQVRLARRVAASAKLYCPSSIEAPWPWFDRYCREGINLHGDNGANLDLHHHVPPWSFARQLTTEVLFDASEAGSLRGEPCRFASAQHCLVIACLHLLNDLWKHSPALLSVRDIITLSKLLGPELTGKALTNANLSWLTPLVAQRLSVFVDASELGFGADVPLPLAISLRLSLLGWPRASRLSDHQFGWAGRLPVANAVAYLLGTAVPSRRYVRQRFGSYRQYWRSGVRSLRQMVPEQSPGTPSSSSHPGRGPVDRSSTPS